VKSVLHRRAGVFVQLFVALLLGLFAMLGVA
jgi:hypothetical protein